MMNGCQATARQACRGSGRWRVTSFVGGSGLHVHTECLGRSFTSRTANYDLAIGLPQPPQPPPQPLQLPPQLAQRLTQTPPGAGGLLTPPAWTFGPEDEHERRYEHDQIMWGIAPGYGVEKVYPESAKYAATVYHCRFYTTPTASSEAEFKTAVDEFLGELDDWWTRFTEWVGILTWQDFVGLGGYRRQGTKSGSITAWTSIAWGQRAGRYMRSDFARIGYRYIS
jgi:hypothetical protein